jgi:hypothetical protein
MTFSFAWRASALVREADAVRHRNPGRRHYSTRRVIHLLEVVSARDSFNCFRRYFWLS